MANPVVEAAYEAVEIEAWGSEHLADFQQSFDTLWSAFKSKAKKVPVSNATNAGGITRPSLKVPFRPQGGAAISQLAAEAAGTIPYFTRGTGSITDAFAVSPFVFTNTCEISNLATWATKGSERGIVMVQKEELKNSLRAFNNGIEGVLNGDGSGTIDQIPATATINNATGAGSSYSSIVGLNTAAGFTDQQTVQVFSAIGGTNRGSFVISFTDPVTQTLYSAGALPAGTTTGDILVVNGASGALNSTVLGLRAWHVNGNTGIVGGINKALYPARLSTPVINLNNTGAVGPSLSTRIEVLRMRAQGEASDAPEDSMYYANPVQGYALSQDFTNRMTFDNKQGGDSVPDTAKKYMQTSFGGVPVKYSSTAQPSRIDRIFFKDWIYGELFDTRLHDWGAGDTIVPVPAIGAGANATYYNSTMFAYEAGFNLVCQNPKNGVYVVGAPVPTV